MSETVSPALSVQQLSVNYEKTPVLWDVNFDIPTHHLVGILGPNGAGKSTLLKASMGLIVPLSGSIRIFGRPLPEVRKRVAYVPQRETVDWDFPITVMDLVLMGRYGKLGLLRRPRPADREAAAHYLELVGMEAFAKRQISQLSGGQQQRVFLARALMQEADLYFMDEPFSGIDASTEAVIVELLRGLRDRGKTIFVVHHDLNTVENYFTWVILLNMRLIASGPSQEAYTKENIIRAYGRLPALLDETARLQQDRNLGLPR